MTDITVQDIFTQLDRDRTNKVPVTEVEGLFKEHSRRSHPNVVPSGVAANILKAFNGDIAFIERELSAIKSTNLGALPQEDTLRFFTKFPGFQSFYSEEELSVIVDFHIRSSGRVELQDFMSELNRALQMNMNLQPNPNI